MKKMTLTAATLSLAFLASLAALGCVVGAGEPTQDSTSAPGEDGALGAAAQALTGNVVIRNVNSDKALNVFGGATDDGRPLIQYTANGGSNELFQLAQTPDGYYTIVAPYDGKCLAVWNGLSIPGQGILQWTCLPNDDHQRFAFVTVSPGIYQIKQKTTGMCLQVFNDSTSDNYAIVQAPCVAGLTSQQFYLQFQ